MDFDDGDWLGGSSDWVSADNGWLVIAFIILCFVGVCFRTKNEHGNKDKD